MKNSYFVFAAALLFAALPLSAAYAATFQSGQVISIPKEQREAENLYLFGKEVTVSTTAQKDLVVAGGQVVVGGPVYGSVLAAGGSVNILQDVNGSVRALGGQTVIAGHVGGDVLAAGGTVTLLPGSVVAGDVIVAGGSVDIEGAVNGQVRAYGKEVTINGVVAGPVSVKAMKSLTFGERAVLGGGLNYSAPQEATVAAGAQLGTNVSFTKSDELNHFKVGIAAGLFALLGVLFVIKFIAMTLSALVVAWVFPKASYALSGEFVRDFWKAALIGFVALIAVPVACVLLAITAIGIYAAILLFFMYVCVLVVAGISMCIFTGALISTWTVKDLRVNWKWIILGSIVVSFVWFVPFVGWIIDAFLFFASVGIVTMSIRRDLEAKM